MIGLFVVEPVLYPFKAKLFKVKRLLVPVQGNEACMSEIQVPVVCDAQ